MLHSLQKKRPLEARPQNTQMVFGKLLVWQLRFKSSLPIEQNKRNKEWVQGKKETKKLGGKETKKEGERGTVGI